MRVLATVLLAVGLAACSRATERAPAASTTLLATPSPAGRVATVAQYASLVARSASDLRQSIKKITLCVAAPEQEPACGLQPLTASLESQTLGVNLDGAVMPTAGQYLGDPPTEITKLVEDTKSAAAHLAEVGQAYTPGDDYFAVYSAATDLGHVLDAWTPYGAGGSS